MKKLVIFFLLTFSQISIANCDFEEIIPNSWVILIEQEDLISHMTDLDRYACMKFVEYERSINKQSDELIDCSDTTDEVHPVLEIITKGDVVGYFSSPEECRSNPRAPLYGGYVVYRNGDQIGFELKVGTHNKKLKWENQSSALASP